MICIRNLTLKMLKYNCIKLIKATIGFYYVEMKCFDRYAAIWWGQCLSKGLILWLKSICGSPICGLANRLPMCALWYCHGIGSPSNLSSPQTPSVDWIEGGGGLTWPCEPQWFLWLPQSKYAHQISRRRYYASTVLSPRISSSQRNLLSETKHPHWVVWLVVVGI